MNQLSLVCTNCNSPVTDDVPFCVSCGQPIKLNGRYQIIEEIVDEGRCTVFMAHDTAHLGKVVAVKRFAPVGKSSQALREAGEWCKHEAGILNSLNHHQIPDVYDCFSERENWYLVIKFMEGETLEARWQRARRKTRLSTEEILSIGEELCSLLDYLHQRSIVFIDLRPANVILGNGKHLDLIGFGNACDLKRGRVKNFEWKITEGYAAPEIAQGKASTRSDIYSLGAILFQLASGEIPSTNLLPSDILDDHRLSRTVPELAQLIAHMMQEDEADRPQSVTDVQKELWGIREKLVVPVTPPQKVNMGRRSFFVGCLVGSLVLSGIGASYVTWFTHKPLVQFPLIVGGKLDNEAALLSEMYLLLLQNAGFLVTDESRLGQTDAVFNALRIGTIDLYPEFLQTGLATLNIGSTYDWHRDFQEGRDGFFKQYQMTWLDLASKLDDTFCVVMPRDSAARLKIKSLSDLASVMQQQSSPFKIAVAPNYEKTRDRLQAVYGITFTSDNITQYDEIGTFTAVTNGFADLSICYSTDPLIAKDHFLPLADDKGKLAVDAPAPLIRNDILNKEPQIATTLNKLAPLLTTNVSIQLQQQVLDGQSPRDVAQQWLKSKGLL